MIDRILLFPYTLTLALRDYVFRKGLVKSQKAEVPTICVGNISVGGTGKTPHAEMIIKTLLRSDEWGFRNIAVLSRGYKRKSKGFQKVTRDGVASLYGDEPLQIAKKFPSVTVAVDRNRVEGCRFLCHPEELADSKKARRCIEKTLPSSDIIILDDGFQYRKLRADVNVVLVDYNRPIHKDMLLPLGRLRDLPRRIREADIIVVTKCPPYLDQWEKGKWAQYLNVEGFSTATCKGFSCEGKEQTLLFSHIGYRDMNPVYEDADGRFIYAKRLILFSGIARDTQIRNYLSDKYRIVRKFNFPDHHRYTSADIRSILHAVEENPTAVVATTEKDAQRVVDTKNVPETLRERLFQVPIEVSFLSEQEKEIFEETLLRLVRERRNR
ncbi:MAG: tetraacyldisaccharide 4'-kinase [Bacteroidales bacterium]|nr:tetraacyldisaccharide 4'-kinase [Bacteroidales bacterium]